MGLNGFIQKRVNQKCFVKPCPRIFHGYYFVYSWSELQIIKTSLISKLVTLETANFVLIPGKDVQLIFPFLVGMRSMDLVWSDVIDGLDPTINEGGKISEGISIFIPTSKKEEYNYIIT